MELLCAASGWGVLEDLFERDVEDVSDAEGYFERRGVFIAFDRDDGLTRDGDVIGKLLLRHGAGGAELADRVAEG
jgi:hypothetical protein